jgi:hypothetical protein
MRKTGLPHAVAAEAETKIRAVGSRHTLYLPTVLVRDSSFPFHPEEALIVRIDGTKLVVERPQRRR